MPHKPFVSALCPAVAVLVMGLTGCNIVKRFPRPEFSDAAVADGSQPDASRGGDVQIPCEPCLKFSTRTATSDGDAEECPDGDVTYTGASLQLTRDDTDGCAGEQTVGVFFQSVEVPAGATVHEATIQFTAAAAGTEPTDLVIWAEDGINPPDFDGVDRNVSNRPRLAGNVSWTVEAWSAPGESGPAQRTPNLRPVVQELVDQPGWASGNAMAFIITGTGQRVAVAFDGEPGQSAELTIRYAPP